MTRGYLVHATRNGEPIVVTLQTSKKSMRLLLNGREVIKEFDHPEVKITKKLGKSRSLFRVDQKPAWWVVVTDEHGVEWPMRCRNLVEAKAIKKWAQRRSEQDGRVYP